MSFPKSQLSVLCKALSLPLSSKDEIIASVADAMLGIVNDITSDILALIDSNNSKIDDLHEI